MSQPSTDEEEAIIGVVRMNRTEPKREWQRKWRIGRVRISAHGGSRHNFWGRFGGGWQWALGFEACRSTINLNLLICSVMVTWYKSQRQEGDL